MNPNIFSHEKILEEHAQKHEKIIEEYIKESNKIQEEYIEEYIKESNKMREELLTKINEMISIVDDFLEEESLSNKNKPKKRCGLESTSELLEPLLSVAD